MMINSWGIRGGRACIIHSANMPRRRGIELDPSAGMLLSATNRILTREYNGSEGSLIHPSEDHEAHFMEHTRGKQGKVNKLTASYWL